MVSINNISYFIGGRPLYKDASMHISSRDKIGLIGLNGTGKTTLLRLITKEYTPDSGAIESGKNCSVGFLNQDLLSYETDDSILTVAMSAFEEAQELQRKIESVLEKLESDYSDKLVEQLTKYQEKYESLEGYTLQAKTEEILEGIGFSTADLHRPLKEFSGGWRMRVMLAKLLLEKPDLLLMDEPTNHLDLPSIEWIENYLNNYEGAYIVVSHDRKFLNNTTKITVEVTNQDLVVYEGNFDFYMKEKILRDEIQRNSYQNQQQKIKQTERFITRFRAKSTKARQVQSKIKSLDRMDKIDDIIESNPIVNFRFDFKQKSGRHVVQIENVTKSYGELTIFKNTTARIERGDKIALIGANGRGKSTLLRMIDGTEILQEGNCVEGYNVNKGFYAQHQLDGLNIENEILDELKQEGSGKTEQELRNTLGCFLFSDDDVFKKIKVLSGGEKSRVALAKTLISECNFLLLDEPTNHLDFQSENILIQALQQYQGTFIIVSHNRHFLSQTANKIWYIENHEIKEYPGTFDEYHYWSEKNNQEKSVPSKSKENVAPVKNTKKKRSKSGLSDYQITQLKTKLIKIESKIEFLEKEVIELEGQLATQEIYANIDLLQEATVAYKEAKDNLDEVTNVWESVVQMIDDNS